MIVKVRVVTRGNFDYVYKMIGWYAPAIVTPPPIMTRMKCCIFVHEDDVRVQILPFGEITTLQELLVTRKCAEPRYVGAATPTISNRMTLSTDMVNQMALVRFCGEAACRDEYDIRSYGNIAFEYNMAWAKSEHDLCSDLTAISGYHGIHTGWMTQNDAMESVTAYWVLANARGLFHQLFDKIFDTIIDCMHGIPGLQKDFDRDLASVSASASASTCTPKGIILKRARTACFEAGMYRYATGMLDIDEHDPWNDKNARHDLEHGPSREAVLWRRQTILNGAVLWQWHWDSTKGAMPRGTIAMHEQLHKKHRSIGSCHV